MGGITTGVGLFSGIDSATLIDQLISLQSRPQVFAQQRIIQLKSQQSAYLDINSRLNAFKTAAAAFRTQDIFSSRSIASSNESVLTASTSSAAVPGSYNFIVDRLVSTQQLLTRGFADLDTTALGLSSITFESEAARLDANTALADLNDGDGITRGKISVNGTEVDLSRSGTVQEVLDAISSVDGVSARVENNKIVIDGLTSLSEDSGAGILASLGLDPNDIALNTLTGTAIFQINDNTSLGSLNDGRGVAIREASGVGVEDFNFVIDTTGDNVPDTTVGIRIGEIEGDDGEGNIVVLQGAVSTIGGVVDRINTQLSDAGYSEFTASINTTTGGIDIVDSNGRDFDIDNYSAGGNVVTTARDLGIEGSYTGGTANGTRVLAGLNTKLVSSLNGGSGLGSTDGILNIQTQDGAAPLAIDVSGLNDINDIINKVNTDSAGAVTASVNTNGTGIQIIDNTTGGTTFSITGTGGSDAAAALGISGSYTDGVADGSNLQLAYIGEASLLSELNDGTGIGTGTFEIVDANNIRAEVIIASSDKTIADVLKAINSASPALDITARINDNGDGIIIEDTSSPAGGAEISIADVSGTVASKLNIDGTATDLGNNFIVGSFEKVVTFDVTDTLEDVRNAINAADVGVSASVINTGIGSAPFRLNLTSELTGEDGRFLVDTGGFDLGITTLDEGNDSRVFFGSNDAATGVLLTSSTNQLDGVVQGVTIDLLSSSADSVEISVSTDNEEIESKIQEFVNAFNNVIEGIDFRTRYDDETEERGILLGDGTLLNLRSAMFSNIRKENDGFTGATDSLSQAGINVGSGGKLEFDAERFREAYAADPQAVEDLFSRQTLDTIDDNDPNTIDEPFFTELSVLGQIEAFAESYVTSIGGVLQNRSDSLDAQIKLQEDRIESIQKGLDNKRLILQRQFLAMEQAIGAFQSQGSSLAQIAAIG
jgi:flagellar hook-associated protein 2